MTESTTLMPGPALDAEPVSERSSRSRTPVFAALALAVILVLGLLAYLFVFSGGDEAEPATATPSTGEPVVPSEPAPGQLAPGAAAADASKRAISQRTFGSDPFEPLVSPESADVATETSAVPDTGTTVTVAPVAPVPPAAPVADVTAGNTGTPITGGTGVSEPRVTADHTFKVVGVSPDGKAISVKVDGKVYPDLKAGEVFAKYFKVVVIGGPVNGFQFGDEKFSVFGTKVLHIAA